jgi:hypothetical protein
MDEDDPRDRYRPSSLDDDDRSRSEYYSHCATTPPLTDDIAVPTNSLDASSLVDATPESANKDSENNIAGPDPDIEHVHDSNAVHELLMDIDDSDESQVDTWSGGIPGSIPKTTTEAPEADDFKESLHFFPNNQQVIFRFIKIRNKLPEGALTDAVSRFLITPSNDSSLISTSFHLVHPECKTVDNASSKLSVMSSRNSLPTRKNSFAFVKTETKLSSALSRISAMTLSVY